MKTKIGIDTLKSYFEKYPNNNVLVISPRTVIRDNWYSEFEKWNFESEKVSSIWSGILTEEHSCDLLIIDEVHSLSELQTSIIKKINPKHIIGLTGTLTNLVERELNFNFDIHLTYEYTIEEAIEDGIISNYEITVHLVELDNKVANVSVSLGKGKNPSMMTEQQAYNFYTKKFEYYREAALRMPTYKRSKMFAAGKRANALYSFRSKIEAVKKFTSKSKDRFLVFTILTKVANELAPYAYHTKSNPKNLERFINQEIDQLASCNMITMGVTVPNLKLGFVHQLQSTEEMAVQKILRMCNLEDERTAQIHIFAYKNTVDEEWVRKALKGLNQSKIKFV